MQHQNSLPSIFGVTASDKSDPSRLPSYRETRRYRYHPYSRPVSVLVNEEDKEDRLLVGFPSFFFPLSSLTVLSFRTRFMMMNASYWMFLPYLLVTLLLLSLSIFIAIWYSSQTLIAPTCATSYGRVRRASPPKYGTRHCIRITCSTSFHSYCGPSFFLSSSMFSRPSY